jgi:hypothetical protein
MQGPAESATCVRSHHLLGLALEPVAVAPKNDDLGVVNQAIDHRGDRYRITKDLGPRRKRLVGIQDQTRALLARADQRKEQRCGLGIERDVADLIYHEERDPAETLELVVEPSRRAYLSELSSLGELRRSYGDQTLVSLLIEAAALHAEANLRIVELAERGIGDLASSSELISPSGEREATENVAEP